MRYREFLIEYNRDITKRQFGKGIVDALAKTRNQSDKRLFNNFMDHFVKQGYSKEQMDDTISQNLLSSFENNDPTPNKQYTPWIAREYVRGNIKALEDLSQIKAALELYHKYKNTAKFKSFFDLQPNGYNFVKDIGKITSDDLENVAALIDSEIVPQDISKDKNKGDAEVVYEDGDVRVIVPKNQDAACYYGQGTRWCTAATKGENYFDNYNRNGPLYIIIPKKPKYQGEKYQLHINEKQFMDEKDDPVSLTKLKDYPGFLKLLKKELDDEDLLLFVDPKEITDINKIVSEYLGDIVWEAVSDMEAEDDNWYEYRAEAAIEKGYVDENGEIDWDRVYEDPQLNDYAMYNDDVRQALRDIKDLEKIQGEQILADIADKEQFDYGWATTTMLEKYYIDWIDNTLGGNYWKRFHTNFEMSKNPDANKYKGLKIKWVGKLGNYNIGFRQY